MKSKSASLADKTSKELHKCFEQFGLKITAEANLHVVNFLDVTFDLNNGKFKPYRKPNDDPLYINRHSNHPASIIKQLPTSINKHISALSADEQTFHESAPIYQNALRGKTEFVLYGSPQKLSRQSECNIAMNNPIINQAKEYEYLGVTLDRHLTLSIAKYLKFIRECHRDWANFHAYVRT